MGERAEERSQYATGGARELLQLAFPLIVSNSFWTLQIAIDRVFLSRLSSDAVGAAMAGALLFWAPLLLLQNTANYATTFVAQYVGAGRPQRVGPAVWQSLYFSVAMGVAFLALVPAADFLMRLGGHSENLRALETTFFQCLCFSALPMLITAAANSFFAGRGQTWAVLLVDAVGLSVTAVLDYVWIFGAWGFSSWGIAGAGWATVAGTSTSAALALALFLRPAFRAEFNTWAGWRFDRELFGRLMRFGLPAGIHGALDCLAFTVFTFVLGRLGDTELAASSIAFTLNMIVFLPMLGIAQAVSVLVGQRLGQDRPELAERTTWTGNKLAGLYMAVIAVSFVVFPDQLTAVFRGQEDAEKWQGVAQLVPVLLRFIAVYSLFDSVNLILSFALRGAGDTRFVTYTALVLAWPVMVVPTILAWYFGWGIYWAWTFASAYIISLAFVLYLRFRQGKWRTMRVIEAVPVGIITASVETASLVAKPAGATVLQ